MASLLDLLGGLNDSERRNRQRQLDYWREREEEQKKHNITDLEEYNRELDKIYATMINDCQNQINDWYLRYASKEGISIAEAKKRVSTADQRYYSERAKEYVANKDFSSRANTEMRLYNLTMKVNRMELLKANLSLAMTSGYNEIEKLTGDFLDKKTLEELKRQAVILGKGVDDVDKQAHRIVNASFKNASFSDRIWTDMDSLRQRVNMQVQRSLIRGLNPVEIARGFMPELRDDVGKAKYATERLARTEMSRVLTDAAKVSMKQNGYDEYMIICERSACSICRPFDGQHFPIEEMEVAENAPPFHPQCLCHVASYMDRDELERMIREIEDERNPQQTEPEPTPPIIPPTSSRRNSGFKKATTIQEAEKFAMETFVDDSQFGGIGVSYKGVGLDVANAINETIADFYTKYDVKKFGGITAPTKNTKLGKMISGATAGYSPIRNSFILNRDHMKSLEKAIEGLSADNEAIRNVIAYPERYDMDKMSARLYRVVEASKTSGRGLVPETIEDVIHHELGHCLENYLKKVDNYQVLTENMNKYAEKISGYATESFSEYVAESFASYCKGEGKIDPLMESAFKALER